MENLTATGPVRVRVAPSPTGDPHVGTAYIALFNRAFARSAGGQFILRIEDTDQERSTKASEAAILRSLQWLGLDWDEGPDIGGPYGPYRQSDRRDIYTEHVRTLVDRGGAYRCFCTKERLDALRTQQRDRKEQLGYDGLCRNIDPAEARRRAEQGEPHVVRLKTPREGVTRFRDEIRRDDIEFENAGIDDQVLVKADGWPTYHLASVVDDHEMKITHVIRAEEWISSTPKHVLLYQAFGWPMPRFFHMPLLRNADKSKISKRKNPTSLDWYRQEGYLPGAIINFLALLGSSMGDGREKFRFDEFVAEFAWARVKTSGPVFDLQKLDWLNGEYIRELTVADLRRLLVTEGFAESDEKIDRIASVLPLIQVRLKKLNEFGGKTAFFFAESLPYDAALLVPKKKDAAETAGVLRTCRAALAALPEWRAADMEPAIRVLLEGHPWKPKDVFMTLRVAATGTDISPPLFECMEAMGKEKSLQRIDDALARLSAP